MAGLSYRLMVTAKERPGQGVSVCEHWLPKQLPDQAQDFWERVGDQPTANPLRHLKACKLLRLRFDSQAFFSCSSLAWSIISVAQT